MQELLDDFAVRSCLVIAPLNVAKYTWATEAKKWDHLHGLRVVPILGTADTRRRRLRIPADVYVINRELVEWLWEEKALDWDYDMIVIDELSSFKSSKSKRWRTLRKVIGKSRYVIGLTGTPASNGYLDLWPEMYLIDQGARLGKTLTAYRDTFFNPGAHKGHVVYDWRLKPGAKQQIDKRLSDICLSMSKEDWLSMPPCLYSETWVGMDKPSRATYEQLKRDKIIPLLKGELTDDMAEADSAIVGAMSATLSGKLRQLANGFAYDDAGNVVRFNTAKLDALKELIEAAQGQPVLVFYEFDADRQLLRGSLPEAQIGLDDEAVEKWNRGEIPVLILHPASAGHGLNLQAGGHIIIWYGLPWSLELYQQANARLYRQGQEHPVTIHHILCQDTIDGRVMDALQAKDNTQRSLLDALKDYVKEEL